jgi:hypothetical protein
MSDLKLLRDRMLEKIVIDSTISDEEYKELGTEEQSMYSPIGERVQYKNIQTLLEGNEPQDEIISSQEYRKLPENEKHNYIEDITDQKYIRSIQIEPDEFDSLIILKLFESHHVIEKAIIESTNMQREILKSITVIKNIVVFILTIGIIASILMLIIQVQRF